MPARKTECLCCPIVELRQYALKPGRRDAFIEIFEREFIESQEELGIRVIGQFRDLDRPDMCVWLRGFPDMEARKDALTTFYSSAFWKARREATNATIIDNDNVLLLRPAFASSGFAFERSRPGPGERAGAGLIAAAIHYLEGPAGEDLLAFHEERIVPVLAEAGADVLASFITEESPNSYPRLPVREGEHVFVQFLRFTDPSAHERHISELKRSHSARSAIAALTARLAREIETLRLMPAARSLLR